ncbi:hypothetical protein WR25_23028 [Diploscapter pachys]|uniref:Uncharacterized protein n=1 Tax=Diploscapter pachys TaxID=2018661 RepID=A0A2A2KAB8_9BILA|nr:hypothetical protein WR25_23028 [Diploscapter pachys]
MRQSVYPSHTGLVARPENRIAVYNSRDLEQIFRGFVHYQQFLNPLVWVEGQSMSNRKNSNTIDQSIHYSSISLTSKSSTELTEHMATTDTAEEISEKDKDSPPAHTPTTESTETETDTEEASSESASEEENEGELPVGTVSGKWTKDYIKSIRKGTLKQIKQEEQCGLGKYTFKSDPKRTQLMRSHESTHMGQFFNVHEYTCDVGKCMERSNKRKVMQKHVEQKHSKELIQGSGYRNIANQYHILHVLLISWLCLENYWKFAATLPKSWYDQIDDISKKTLQRFCEDISILLHVRHDLHSKIVAFLNQSSESYPHWDQLKEAIKASSLHMDLRNRYKRTKNTNEEVSMLANLLQILESYENSKREKEK